MSCNIVIGAVLGAIWGVWVATLNLPPKQNISTILLPLVLLFMALACRHYIGR